MWLRCCMRPSARAADRKISRGLPISVSRAPWRDARKLVDGRGRPLLPSLAAETIVYDHGKVYLFAPRAERLREDGDLAAGRPPAHADG